MQYLFKKFPDYLIELLHFSVVISSVDTLIESARSLLAQFRYSHAPSSQ